MSPEEVRDAFRAFAGEEQFRKFVVDFNTWKGLHLLVWQEQLWEVFARTLPLPGYPFDAVRDLFRVCPDHGCDVCPGPEPFPYDVGALVTAPDGIDRQAYGYARERYPLAVTDQNYCPRCRDELRGALAGAKPAPSPAAPPPPIPPVPRARRGGAAITFAGAAAGLTGAAGFAAGLLAGWLVLLGYAHYLMWLHHCFPGDVFRVIWISTATLAVVWTAFGAVQGHVDRWVALDDPKPPSRWGRASGWLFLPLGGACFGFTAGVLHANWSYDEPYWFGGGYGFYSSDPAHKGTHPGDLGVMSEAIGSVPAIIAFFLGFGGLFIPLVGGMGVAVVVGRQAWNAPVLSLLTWLPLCLVAAAVLFVGVGVAGPAWGEQHLRLQTRLEGSMKSVLAQRDALLVGAAVEGVVAPGMAAGGYVEGLRRLEAGEVRNCPHRFQRAFRDHLRASAELAATVVAPLGNPLAAVRVLIEKGGFEGVAESVKGSFDTALRSENGMRMELAQVSRRLDQMTGRAGP